MYKVNKTVARKMFNKGRTISLYTNKVNPRNEYIEPYTIQRDEIANTITNQSYGTIGFDNIVSQFEAANCNYLVGMYTAYYIHKEH